MKVKVFRSFCIITIGMSLLLIITSVAFSWNVLARPRASMHIDFRLQSLRRRSQTQNVAPQWAAWNLFAPYKAIPLSENATNTLIQMNQSLPCIHIPAPFSHWNSSICLLYALSPRHQPLIDSVTAVVHFSEDRLNLIATTCSRWGGPVLGVLFLYHDQLELLASLVGAANAIQGSDDNCARHLELFVALDVRPKGLSYPINLLRNIGSVAAATRRVVSLDADFVPSVNAAVDLALLPDTVGREDSPTACVLPVFQYVDGHKLPPSSNKEELLAMIVFEQRRAIGHDCVR